MFELLAVSQYLLNALSNLLLDTCCTAHCCRLVRALRKPSGALQKLKKRSTPLTWLLLSCPYLTCCCTIRCSFWIAAAHCRLVRALEEAKRRAAKAQKEKHAADLAAAELRGKAEAEKDGQRMEVCELCLCLFEMRLHSALWMP
jgi:hypothetical protein